MIRKFTKGIFIAFISILIVFVLLFGAIQTRFFKRFAKNQAQDYLTKKLGTEFRLETIDYSLLNWIELKGIFLRDQAGDTLLYGNKIRVDLNMLKLISSQVAIEQIELDGIYGNIIRTTKDSTFNYQYIIDAFSSKTPQIDTTQSSSTSINIDKVAITKSAFNWKDAYGGMDIHMKVEKLSVAMDKIDLDKQEYFVKNADVNKLVILAQQSKNNAPDSPQNEGEILPFVKVGSMKIAQSKVQYFDAVNNLKSINEINDFSIKNVNANLTKNDIKIGKIDLNNNTFVVNKNKPTEVLPKAIIDSVSTDSFKLNITEIDLNNNHIIYNDNTKAKTTKGVDYAHLDAKKLTIKAKNIVYNGKKTAAELNNLVVNEKSGLVINHVSGDFLMDEKAITVQKLDVRTPNSFINGDVLVYQAALNNQFLSDEINTIRFDNTVIGKKDIEFLVPQLAASFNKELKDIKQIYITADAKGTSKILKINNLNIFTNKKDAYIEANGIIKNAFDTKNLGYDMTFNRVFLQKSFLNPIIASVEPKIYLPPTLILVGNAKGNLNEVATSMKLNSAYGIANLEGTIKNFNNPTNLIYDARLIADKLETGKWIGQDSLMGPLSANIYAKGKGIDYKNASIISDIKVASFRYLQHVYENVVLSLNGTGGQYDFNANSTDKELMFNALGSTNLTAKHPTLVANIDLQNVNLYTLGLYDEPLTVQTNGVFKVKNLDPKNLDALIVLDSSFINLGTQKFFIDSLTTKGYVENQRTVLKLVSPLANANIEGDYNYNELGDIFNYLLAKYKGENPVPLRTSADFSINALIKTNPMYGQLVEGLVFDEPITLNGEIYAGKADSTVNLALKIPTLKYGTNSVENFDLSINGTTDSLKYTIQTQNLVSGNLLFFETNINGAYSKQAVNAVLNSKDEKGVSRYGLGIRAFLEPNETSIKLDNKFLLDYNNWTVDNKNLVRLNDFGFNISDFILTRNNQTITAQSNSSTMNSPIKLDIKNFRLQNISGILNKDSLLVAGILNVNLQAENFKNAIPTIDGTLKVDSLVYNKIPVGNLALKARSENTNVSMSGGLTGNGNNVDITGKYSPENMNIDLNLNPIKVQTIEPFSLGYLTRSNGNLSGKINIQGTPTNPTAKGIVSFDSVSTTLGEYGTLLKIDKQKIDINYPTITLNNLQVRDSLNNILTVDGTLKNDNIKGFMSDLSVKANNFVALDSKQSLQTSFYGKAIIDANLQLKGVITTPEVSGNITVNDKSKITYIREREIPGLKDREGVMAFIDMDTVKNILQMSMIDASNVGKTAAITYEAPILAYNLNIDITKDAEFNIIIDPSTGDQLSVAGPATLNVGVNPNGSLMLTGAYNLNKGKYILNYQFIKREFKLQDGSSIIFKGEPTDAEANITAVYEVQTRPIDLIRNEITAIGEAEKIYQQKFPFLVELKITGTLLEPKLAFDIKLKENVAGLSSTMSTVINNKLTQLRYDASSLNKQVFALLVLNRFFGEQARDFFAGGGSSTQDVIKESVSRFLSDAVNQIAADLIKGVDLNVDLKSVDDYASAAKRTDLDLALSKRFLNDRLSLTVGKNFTLEGEDPVAKSQSNNSVQFLPDISTSYKLSKDGKYLVRAYRRNQYETILDGYFIETGVVFSFSLDYDRLKELMNKK